MAKSKSKRKKPNCRSGKSFACGFSCQPIERNGKKVKCRSNVNEKGVKIVEDYSEFLRRTDPRSSLEQLFNLSAKNPTGDELAAELERRLRNDQNSLMETVRKQIEDQELADLDLVLDLEARVRELDREKEQNKALNSELKKRASELAKDKGKNLDPVIQQSLDAAKRMTKMKKNRVDLKKTSDKAESDDKKKKRDIKAVEKSLDKVEIDPKTGLVDHKAFLEKIKKSQNEQQAKFKGTINRAKKTIRDADKTLKDFDQFMKDLGVEPEEDDEDKD